MIAPVVLLYAHIFSLTCAFWSVRLISANSGIEVAASVPMAGIDRVVPTGTAVQNARTSALPILTRDGYHLSYGAGRYLAGLTFLQALIGMRIDELNWAPDGMKEYEKRVSLESARNALEKPFEVTPVSVQKTDLN